jgi:hypothetical protein
LKPEYNINPTASSRLGAKYSEESREKISKIITDFMQFSDLKEKISKALKGRTIPLKTKEKLSIANGSIIFIHTLELECLQTFPSSRSAAEPSVPSAPTILKYAQSNKIFRDQYILSLGPLKSNFQPTPLKKYQITIFVYLLDSVGRPGQLFNTFPSSKATAKHFNCSHHTILKYAKSQEIFKNKYVLSLDALASESK